MYIHMIYFIIKKYIKIKINKKSDNLPRDNFSAGCTDLRIDREYRISHKLFVLSGHRVQFGHPFGIVLRALPIAWKL